MIFKNVEALIENDKVEEVLELLKLHVKNLPEIFQTTLSIQYSIYTKHKWDTFIHAEDVKSFNKLKKELIEFSRSIEYFEETGEIPSEYSAYDAKKGIKKSKNFNTGNINAGRDVNIGDK